MAKLTDEQKTKNKAARRILEKAFNERRQKYQAAKEKALSDFDANSPLKSESEVAFASCEAARIAREQERDALYSQICALQDQIKGLDIKWDMDRLSRLRRETGDACYKARICVEETIDAIFPDVAGVWSASAWKPSV